MLDTSWYDRDGFPIPSEGAEKLLADRNYVVVARTKVLDAADPGKYCDVSTVWLGHDHGDGLPVIFETLVFVEGDDEEEDGARYWSEDEAKKGHTELVVAMAAKFTDPVVMDSGDGF